MQKLRNLPLAVRLGGAFGALALGLLVVSLVAFRSTDNLQTKVDALAVDVPQYTALVDGVAKASSASAEQVSATTQETSASAQEIASSAHELARTAEDMERLVGQFKMA